MEAFDNKEITWNLPCSSLTGNIGENVTAGTNKHILWDFYADNPNTSGSNYQIRVTAHCLVCAQTITEDLKFTRDIFCQHPVNVGYACAITIGAPNITLDLDGYTLSGEMNNGHIEGILAESYDGLNIRNGTLLGFSIAIPLIRSDNTIIENLTIKNLDIDDPDIPCGGIVAGSCQNLLIRDCYFEFLDTHHKEGVIISNSVAAVENIEQHYGSVGVNYGGSVEFKPTRATVRNCRFYDSKISGILVQLTDSAHILKNIFTNSSIIADPAQKNFVSGLVIEDNEIKDCDETSGVNMIGTIGALIENNSVSNCDVGISLTPSRGCAGDTAGSENCFYATGNIIRDNIVLGNNIDLLHYDNCLGNTWEGNTYETAHGVEVYTVNPSTAREYLFDADSTAKRAASDAKLLLAVSLNCDSTGTSYDWAYIYESKSLMEKYELRLINGIIAMQETVTLGWLIGEDAPPTTEPWIDSDSAIFIAEGMGGKQFRELYELTTIEMALYDLYWNIHYVSQDTIFSVSFNAKTE